MLETKASMKKYCEKRSFLFDSFCWKFSICYQEINSSDFILRHVNMSNCRFRETQASKSCHEVLLAEERTPLFGYRHPVLLWMDRFRLCSGYSGGVSYVLFLSPLFPPHHEYLSVAFFINY